MSWVGANDFSVFVCQQPKIDSMFVFFPYSIHNATNGCFSPARKILSAIVRVHQIMFKWQQIYVSRVVIIWWVIVLSNLCHCVEWSRLHRWPIYECRLFALWENARESRKIVFYSVMSSSHDALKPYHSRPWVKPATIRQRRTERGRKLNTKILKSAFISKNGNHNLIFRRWLYSVELG